MKQLTILILLIVVSKINVFGQTVSAAVQDSVPKAAKDTSGFDKFNKKAENLFRILPVPIYSYNNLAGNIYGLAKFNVISLSKKDTISKPSKLSGVFTVSSNGNINASVAANLVFNQDNDIVITYVNFQQQPEYIFGIGNNVTKENAEPISSTRILFAATWLRQFLKHFYAGIAFSYANYFNIQTDSNSFLKEDTVAGVNGGASVGIGFAFTYDTRDNRYNASKGGYIIGTFQAHPSWIGSVYQFSRFDLDARKFFHPWTSGVIALQATTTYCNGNTPFYSLAEMGGSYQMRGYYEGAFRDNVLVDAQVEYRQHVWNIFGATAFFGVGQVGPNYSAISLNGFHLDYGGGLRIRVDSKHNTNLRFDFGFGPGGIQGVIINFAEAF
jgi:Omp85 superfamily domain